MIKKEPSSRDILKGIAGAFSKIGIKDRRVTRLHMSEEMFHRLLVGDGSSISNFMSSHLDFHFAEGCINPLDTARTDPLSLNFWTNSQWNPTGLTPDEHPVATIWGSGVYIRKNFEVVSDPISNLGPLWTIRPPVQANPDGTYTVLPPTYPVIIEPVEVTFDKLEYLRQNLIW
jgi:hypothetical protein